MNNKEMSCIVTVFLLVLAALGWLVYDGATAEWVTLDSSVCTAKNFRPAYDTPERFEWGYDMWYDDWRWKRIPPRHYPDKWTVTAKGYSGDDIVSLTVEVTKYEYDKFTVGDECEVQQKQSKLFTFDTRVRPYGG